MKVINADGTAVADLPDNLAKMLLERKWAKANDSKYNTVLENDLPDFTGAIAPTQGAIKGNQTGIYHTPDSPNYKQCKAERYFDTEEEAQAAGFRRWGKQTDEDA